jgi:DNA replication protein DnaC
MPCPICSAKRKAERLQKICGLTDAERGANLSQIIVRTPNGGTDKMVKAAREFIAAPYGLLTIHGTCGNAKTVVLQSIVNAMLAQSVTAIYTTFYDVVSWVRESFNSKDEDSVSVKVARLRDVPVLCIDELDKVKPTEWVVELQTQLIDLRYRRGLSRESGTVFAMNGTLDTLPDWFASRLRDGRNVVVENNDKDLRPLMRGK